MRSGYDGALQGRLPAFDRPERRVAGPDAMKLLLAVLVLLLASCAGERESADIERSATAAFAPGTPDVVEVRLVDRLALESAELVAPDGRIFLAREIERDRVVEAPSRPGPGFGVGVFGGSSGHVGTSVGIGFPIGGFGDGAGETRVESRARIPVGDGAAYRAGWQSWKIRLKVGTPAAGNVRFMEIPAPRPPEG